MEVSHHYESAGRASVSLSLFSLHPQQFVFPLVSRSGMGGMSDALKGENRSSNCMEITEDRFG